VLCLDRPRLIRDICKIDVNIIHGIHLYNMDLSKAIEEYLKTLTAKQYKAYEIARDHLRDSFQIEKSNGFLSWVRKNQIVLA